MPSPVKSLPVVGSGGPVTSAPFASVRSLEAERYHVYVDAEHADDAIRRGGL